MLSSSVFTERFGCKNPCDLIYLEFQRGIEVGSICGNTWYNSFVQLVQCNFNAV